MASARKPRARKPPARPQRVAASPAQLARTGKLAALARLSDDRAAYMWLCAADDFGHEEAAGWIDHVEEVSSLRHDDGGTERAAAHWELAVAYLEGGLGLPLDLALAKKHLLAAFASYDLETINAGANQHYSADQLLGRLDDDARTLLLRGLNRTLEDRYDRAIERINRVRRLRECSAPSVIVDHELECLAEEITEVRRDDDEREAAEARALLAIEQAARVRRG